MCIQNSNHNNPNQTERFVNPHFGYWTGRNRETNIRFNVVSKNLVKIGRVERVAFEAVLQSYTEMEQFLNFGPEQVDGPNVGSFAIYLNTLSIPNSGPPKEIAWMSVTCNRHRKILPPELINSKRELDKMVDSSVQLSVQWLRRHCSNWSSWGSPDIFLRRS